MESTLIAGAEVLAGIGCLVLAVILFKPLKRFAATRQQTQAAKVFVLDEMLVLGWLLMGVVGVTLILYGLL